MNKSGRTWASQMGYYNTKSWRDLRAYVLEVERFCRMCMGMRKRVPADMVDHIVAINEENFAELFLDINNLQPLCHACHQFKTNRDKCGKDDYPSMDEILAL